MKPKLKQPREAAQPEKREALWTEREVAAFAQISLSRLRKMRMRGARSDLPFARLGRSVRYRREDVYRWVDAQIVGAVSAPALRSLVSAVRSSSGFTVRELLEIRERLDSTAVMEALAGEPEEPPAPPPRRGSRR